MSETATSVVLKSQSEVRARALLLAAGRGERMRPLTDHCPKPLLEVRGKPLLHWHLDALAQAGIQTVAINTAYLEAQIEGFVSEYLGISANRSAEFGPLLLQNKEQTRRIVLSREGRDFGGALETLGGICRALPLLDDVFWLAASDVFMPGFDYAPERFARFAASDALAHIWLVPNPAHKSSGDFDLGPDGRCLETIAPGRDGYTYATRALFKRSLFTAPFCDIAPGNPQGVHAQLVTVLRAAMRSGVCTGEIWHGEWTDVGTPERLAALNLETAVSR